MSTARASVLAAVGLPVSATQAETAELVAREAGLSAPRGPRSEEFLVSVVEVLGEVCAAYDGDLVDTAQVANAVHGRLFRRWPQETWRAVGAELGTSRLDDAVWSAVAGRLAPRLGNAGLLELAGGTWEHPVRGEDGP
ncbi:MAG: hypothetical protein QOE65_2361 [Solirubrobacteraceae bacterium]|jgi:hypothetical protein|nr:hypothetical protein [Solirubrobacteraceae bacterium]